MNSEQSPRGLFPRLQTVYTKQPCGNQLFHTMGQLSVHVDWTLHLWLDPYRQTTGKLSGGDIISDSINQATNIIVIQLLNLKLLTNYKQLILK